ncbi:monocarboxylate transporter 10-like isoform X1 [Cloeon dipterum]|uniref:monocarboxylate transporter 10-like isoform X1 n=1 Tax=Cloeon dipterum TaxID=197152 RepID=UPI0032208B3B
MTRPGIKLLRSRTWPVVSGVDDELDSGQQQVIHYSYAELPGLADDGVAAKPPAGNVEVGHPAQLDARPDLLDSCCAHRDENRKFFEEKGKKCEQHELPALMVCDPKKTATLYRHYYPEGGWGYVIVTCSVLVSVLGQGLQLSFGHLISPAENKFGVHNDGHLGWVGAMSTAVALFVSPVTISFCRRKSTRVTAVLGGLVTALGCLFTSFATQFHQLFFSYGAVIGVGVGMTRDTSTLMVAQYFKRKRELVEIFIVAGSGLGLAIMSAFIKGAIGSIGWRLGLQAVTVTVFLTFFLGTFYRSASLYHPQRRAILHLKNQKRKIKDKNKADDRPPFFDLTTLRSKTVRILLASTAISAMGMSTPIFYMAHQAEKEGLGDATVSLQAYLGLAWALGCGAFGMLVVRNSAECRIARQYLCQACTFVCGIAILALTAVQGYRGYLLFVWVYGIFCGGYHYSLKMYTYERVRARNFARTWGFVQCSQALPIAFGVPITGYINEGYGGKAGYYFSSTCVLIGSAALSLIDVHRRRVAKHKHTAANGKQHTCIIENCPDRRSGRRLSFTDEDVNGHNGAVLQSATGGPATAAAAAAAAAALLGQRSLTLANMGSTDLKKPELTCISEEGIADMDLPDNLLDDLDYIGDCITSCNKVENYLMLSEFENNLIAEVPVITDRKGRRWSLARPHRSNNSPFNEARPSMGLTLDEGEGCSTDPNSPLAGACVGPSNERRKSREMPPFRSANWRLLSAAPKRTITVIDEASV